MDASQYADVKPVFWSAVKLFETVKGDIIAQKVLQRNFSAKKEGQKHVSETLCYIVRIILWQISSPQILKATEGDESK